MSRSYTSSLPPPPRASMRVAGLIFLHLVNIELFEMFVWLRTSKFYN
jgi:hypothetical protein